MMIRGILGVVLVATMACAQGDQSDESAKNAERPLTHCDGSALPKTGDRCDRDAAPADAYCRMTDCTRNCEEECRCNTAGRWECLIFCRDNFGCGTPPLCGVNCGGDAASSD